MRRVAGVFCVLLMSSAVILVLGAALAAGVSPVTVRVSVSSSGVQGSGSGYEGNSSVSADGRYVAFSSHSPNLVRNDTNRSGDIFLRDTMQGTTRRVSLTWQGRQAHGSPGMGGGSIWPSISADGSRVVFLSDGQDLVPGQTNKTYNVFVRDIRRRTTREANLSSTGSQANGISGIGTISGSGRYVVFDSEATNLVPRDTNSANDVFVRDLTLDKTTRVSVSTSGAQADGPSLMSEPDVTWATISGDGRYVAFDSQAVNLVAGDTNHVTDVFLRDLQAGTTRRVSLSGTGAQGNGSSIEPDISPDGRYIAFLSDASNLVPGDTNGRRDVFVRDVKTGRTTRVNVSSTGTQANWWSRMHPRISRDGRYVAFASQADTLVPGPVRLCTDPSEPYKYPCADVYRHDLSTGRTIRVTLASNGDHPAGFAFLGSMTPDGRFVTFSSNASKLISGDTNRDYDVFKRGPLP